MIRFLFILLMFMPGGASLAYTQPAQNQAITPPKNFQEVKERGGNFLEAAKEKLPTIMEDVWKNQIVPFWKKIDAWTKNNILSKMEHHYQKINSGAREKIKKQGPIVKEGLEKKLPKSGESFWEKFKVFIGNKFSWVIQ